MEGVSNCSDGFRCICLTKHVDRYGGQTRSSSTEETPINTRSATPSKRSPLIYHFHTKKCPTTNGPIKKCPTKNGPVENVSHKKERLCSILGIDLPRLIDNVGNNVLPKKYPCYWINHTDRNLLIIIDLFSSFQISWKMVNSKCWKSNSLKHQNFDIWQNI